MRIQKTSVRVWITTVALSVLFTAAAVLPWHVPVVLEAQGNRRATIAEGDLHQWLTYLSSDELQGRQIFTEG